MEQSDNSSQNKKSGVTWAIAVKIWWWITWRTIVFSFLWGAFVGFVFGMIGIILAMFIHDQNVIGSIKLLGIMLLAIPSPYIIQIYLFKKVLSNKFKDFSFLLVKPE